MEKKSTTLKIASVVILIGGIYSLIVALAPVLGLVGAVVDNVFVNPLRALAFICLLVIAVLDVYAGVVGLKVSAGNGNIELCKKLAIIVIVIAVLSLILNSAVKGASYNIVMIILNLLFPVLYFVGVRSYSK